MNTSTLFLDFQNDSKFHVIDKETDFSFGEGYEIPDAVSEARKSTNEPIHFGENVCGIPRVMVTEKPSDAIEDAEIFISALAEISGMQIFKLFDDNMHFNGYSMEVIE